MRHLKQQFARLAQSKAAKSVGVFVAGTVAAVSSAHAALPTEATAAFTALGGNVTDITTAVWPILGAVTGAFALMRLFKRGARNAV